jgi:hypothetical protein
MILADADVKQAGCHDCNHDRTNELSEMKTTTRERHQADKHR